MCNVQTYQIIYIFKKSAFKTIVITKYSKNCAQSSSSHKEIANIIYQLRLIILLLNIVYFLFASMKKRTDLFGLFDSVIEDRK